MKKTFIEWIREVQMHNEISRWVKKNGIALHHSKLTIEDFKKREGLRAEREYTSPESGRKTLEIFKTTEQIIAESKKQSK